MPDPQRRDEVDLLMPTSAAPRRGRRRQGCSGDDRERRSQALPGYQALAIVTGTPVSKRSRKEIIQHERAC